MEQRTFRASGLKMSVLAFGGMNIGDSRSFAGITMANDVARRVLDAGIDAGIDTINTANMYSDGRSEELIGEWIRDWRHSLTLSTKIRFPSVHMPGAPEAYGDVGLSRHAIIRACEGSLRRLGTDYIDILQMHMQDGSVPIEETLRAFDDLIRAGKVRYVACSNFTAYRLVEALWAADRRDLVAPCCLELPWSLVQRDAERELVPATRAFGLGLMVYSPLGRGLLSGKYKQGEAAPAGSRKAEWPTAFDVYDSERSWRVVDAVTELAARHETSPSAVSIAWLLARPETTTVIIGVRSEEQLQQNLSALSVRLTAAELSWLDDVSEPDWGYPYTLIQKYEPW